VGLCPNEGLAAVVPAVEEDPALDHQLADPREGAAVDALALDDPEPNLDALSQDLSSGDLSSACARGSLRSERQDDQTDYCAQRHCRAVPRLQSDERAELHRVRFR
jgi:hypothetical protein